MPHDVVIRNAEIIDGSGKDRFRADVGVSDGVIVEIGKVDLLGVQEIDGEGHVITPGFIDAHTHMDAQVMWDPLGASSCWQGVTSVVMGNCGFTLAPVHDESRDLVVRNLERAEDISAEALAAGLEWGWTTFAEYLDVVDAKPKAINYAGNVGHSALRTWAMGERAFQEEANEDDLRSMEAELGAALEAGAVGLTTSRSHSHLTPSGGPVASRLAAWSEVRRLTLRMASARRKDLLQLAVGLGSGGDDPAALKASLSALRDLAVESETPITFGLLPNKPMCYEVLDAIDSTCDAGGTIFAQTHSRGLASVLSFKTQMPFDVLDLWRDVRALPLAEQRRALIDADLRRRLVEIARGGTYPAGSSGEPRPPDYQIMRVMTGPLPPYPSVMELATERGIDPVELIINLAVESDLGQFFIQPFRVTDPVDQLALLKHPRTVMTFSDSGAHVSQIMDASIQTHLLAYWVRKMQAFTLEEAVRMVTLAPAKAWGFARRGLVAEGFVADLNIIDPARVGPTMPTVERDLPGGGARLEQRATGILGTFVAGNLTTQDGSWTGALPGRLLRRGPGSQGIA